MMRICDIVRSNRCLLDKEAPVSPEHNLCVVKDIFEELLHDKLGPDFTVSVDGTGLSVHNEKFDAEVREFITENKLAYPEMYMSGLYYHEVLLGKLGFHNRISGSSDDRISGEVSGTARLFERKKNAFEALKKFIEDKKWLVQCVNRINLSSIEDNDYNIEWSILDLEITPELLDGFISTVKMVVTAGLTDEEAGAWRQHIIEMFRAHAYRSIASVDFNWPSITIDTPEKWKKDYHERYKPEQERRERCAGVLEEIRGKIDTTDIKRQALLQQLLELNYELP